MNGSETHGARPVVVGANHRSSSLGLRDRLFVEDADVPGFLENLKAGGVTDAVLLSTCDRVEVQAVHADPKAAARVVLASLAAHAGAEPDELDGQVYVMDDERAVEQVFCVAASLDSQIIGEPQVLGQVKAAHRQAREVGMVGGELESLMQAAYAAAKKVRTETAIGERPVSIAAAAADLARDVHGELDRVGALMIGVGEMGHLVAEHMVSGGLQRLTVTHPRETRAAALARQLDCHRIAFEDRAQAMTEADVVICALGRRDYAMTADMVQSAIKARRRRPVFLVDVAVPGDVDPAVDRLDEAFVYDLEDLERIVSDGRASREAEAEAGRRIVAAEVAGFTRGRAQRAAVPAVRLLRDRAEAIRAEVLAEAGGDAEKATRLLVSRLLHDPSINLRQAAAGAPGELEALESALKALFGLNGAETPADAGPEEDEKT